LRDEGEQLIIQAVKQVRMANGKQLTEDRRLIRMVWKGSFTLFRRIYHMVQLSGVMTYSDALREHDSECTTRSSAITGSACDHRIAAEIIHSLLARACTTAQAIDYTIGNGYVMESMTMLRSVYEALVIAAFIAQDMPTRAVRYYDFSTLAYYQYRDARSAWAEGPEFDPLVDVEVRETQCRQICRRYGYPEGGRVGDYEWARPYVSVNPRKKIVLRHLEDLTAFAERQGLYKVLCDAVHVSSAPTISNWLTQVNRGNAFIPTVDGSILFGTVPEAILATSLMLRDFSATVCSCWDVLDHNAALQGVQDYIGAYTEVLRTLLADVHAKARTAIPDM
jgi:Family of unknown function (DUF5677)